MYRDVADAVTTLYGEKWNGQFSVHRRPPGGEDITDDLAAAWIRGEHDRVNAAVATHVARVRARVVIVKSSRRIIELAKLGKTAREIAVTVKRTENWVRACCKKNGVTLIAEPLTRARRKANPSRLAELRSTGMTLAQIAKAEGLCLTTVCRVLKQTSSTSMTRSALPATPPSTASFDMTPQRVTTSSDARAPMATGSR